MVTMLSTDAGKSHKSFTHRDDEPVDNSYRLRWIRHCGKLARQQTTSVNGADGSSGRIRTYDPPKAD
jgi:hypothetical protein